MSVIVALDQGTTSSRAIIFDKQGNILSMAQKEFHQIFPKPGWVEHDANEIWESQCEVAEQALNKLGLKASDVTAAGITNQRETTVIWDRSTGEPIGNAIVWQDRRTASLCKQLKNNGKEQIFRDKTGLVLDAYFSGTKISWMLDNIPNARSRAENGELAFGTIDSWLAFKMSDGKCHVTDPSNACRTLLFDINTGAWDKELLKILHIPETLLPVVKSSSEIYFEITYPTALKGVPLAGIVGDQQAATMGQVCVEPGLAKNTYGTGCFLLKNTGHQPQTSNNQLLSTIGWQQGGKTTYALEGSVFVGGAIVQWLRDGLKIIEKAPDIEPLANSVDDTGDVIFVPALAGLGAPHWDPYARGAILGITRGTTSAHIARAALEGVAFSVADLVAAMESDDGKPLRELRVDGGAAANNLLMQTQADFLQTPVVRPTVLETTALGAAYMAGLATGFWSSLDEISSNWQVDRVFEPQISADQAKYKKNRWQKAVNRSKGWIDG